MEKPVGGMLKVYKITKFIILSKIFGLTTGKVNLGERGWEKRPQALVVHWLRPPRVAFRPCIVKGVHYQKCTIIANFRNIQKAGPYTVFYKIRMVLKHKST